MTKIESVALKKIASHYQHIEPFVQEFDKFNYIMFDFYVVNKVSLYIFDPDFNFNYLAETGARIARAMNAISAIFSKPLLHLIDESVVIPIEAVRHIDKNTIQHIATHSELWEDLYQDSIKPNRLLTKIYQDNYGIYENLIFCNTIDKVLLFVRENIKTLKEIIFTKRMIELNLLERVNHINYFLALGKLHTSYIHFFAEFYDQAEAEITNLTSIFNRIVPKLNRPVYRKNQKRSRKLPLRKTNIFAMHKYYRHVFQLAKYLKRKELALVAEFTEQDQEHFCRDYFNFCQMILIFAIGHFNFKFNERRRTSFTKLSMKATFKKWTLTLKALPLDPASVLIFDLEADSKKRIVAVPYATAKTAEEREEALASIKEQAKADHLVVLTPFEEDVYPDDELLISINNLDSFRRLQQLLLKTMIEVDTTRDECPFCHSKLKPVATHLEEDHRYLCTSCRMVIVDTCCPTTNLPYSYTVIDQFQQAAPRDKSVLEADEWFQNRRRETQMSFRNITKLDQDMKIICPRCHQVHREH